MLSGTMAILKLKRHPSPPPSPPLPRPNDDPVESLFKQVFKITKVISI